MRLWGPVSAFGLGTALFVAVVDQIQKAWTIAYFAATHKAAIEVASFFDVVMVWNRGVSYGLFKQDSDAGRFGLVALALAAAIALTLWLAAMHTRFSAAAVGLIIGGALGNAADRAYHGAVADFFSFHVGSFHWYIFNLADAAIVAGVAGLLYESFKSSHKRVENQI